jgi:hypothetical protein
VVVGSCFMVPGGVVVMLTGGMFHWHVMHPLENKS